MTHSPSSSELDPVELKELKELEEREEMENVASDFFAFELSLM